MFKKNKKHLLLLMKMVHIPEVDILEMVPEHIYWKEVL